MNTSDFDFDVISGPAKPTLATLLQRPPAPATPPPPATPSLDQAATAPESLRR